VVPGVLVLVRSRIEGRMLRNQHVEIDVASHGRGCGSCGKGVTRGPAAHRLLGQRQRGYVYFHAAASSQKPCRACRSCRNRMCERRNPTIVCMTVLQTGQDSRSDRMDRQDGQQDGSTRWTEMVLSESGSSRRSTGLLFLAWALLL